MLCHEGGRWSSAEVAKYLGSNPKITSTCLSNMVEAGSVIRYDKTGQKSRVRFAVTSACHIPRTVKVGDLLEILREVGRE